MDDRPTIRIFISSPKDVRPERLIAERVVRRLAHEFENHFDVRSIMWEREPLLASQHSQALILPPSDADIVLVILWSNLGVLLPTDKFLGQVSGRPVTGTEWEFEDALAGFRLRQSPDMLLYRKTAEVTVTLGNDADVAERQRQVHLVEDFIQRWTLDVEGNTYTAMSWQFVDGTAFETLVSEHLRALLRKRLGTRTANAQEVHWHKGSPYRGLEAFEPEHEEIFFGRTRARNEVRELLSRQCTRGCAFVLIIGASGSGKSSLVKAGLVPDLTVAGAIDAVGLVRTAIVRPGSASTPIDALAAALLSSSALPELCSPPLNYTAQSLASMLRHTPDQLTLPLIQGLSAAGRQADLTPVGEARVLIVIDQLEELFTMENLDPPERDFFVGALDKLTKCKAVWIIATMRSDFFGRLDQLPALATLTGGEAKYLLRPPDQSEIGQIVRLPARAAGLRFEVDSKSGAKLDEVIAAAASANTSSLPLLEYLLDQLWSRREPDGVLTFSAYQALGGLEGAIGARAEDVLAAQPEEVKAALPRLLRALVTIASGGGGVPTARHTKIDRFLPGTPERHLVEAFLHSNARLLVTDGGNLRIAHEALLENWDRARQHIAEDESDLKVRARLEEAEARWRTAKEADQDSLLLPPGVPLTEGEDLVKRRSNEIDPEVVNFVEKSAKAARGRARRAIRSLQVAVSLFASLALAAAFFGWEADRNRKDAELTLEKTLGLVDTVVIDTVRRFKNLGLPANDVRALLGAVETALAGLGKSQFDDRIVSKQITMFHELVRAYLAVGDVNGAKRSAQIGQRLSEARLERDPTNALFLGEVAVSYDRIGEVLQRSGDLNGALNDYRAARTIRKGLVDRIAGNANWQSDLAWSYNNIGAIFRALGMLDKAQEEHNEALKIVTDLDNQDRTRGVHQHDLAWTNNALGLVLQQQGNLTEARKAFQMALKIRKDLANEQPGNTARQSDVAGSHRNIGDVSYTQGDLADAESSYRAALDICRSLERNDPSNTDWRSALAASLNGLGDVLSRRSKRDDALRAYHEARSIRDQLVRQDYDNTDWRSDLARSYDGIGSTQFALGHLPDAESAFRIALTMRDQLADRDRNNEDWKSDVALSFDNIGSVFEAQNDLQNALDAYRQALEIREEFADRKRTNTRWQRYLLVSHVRIATILRLQDDAVLARQELAKAEEISRLLIRRYPDNDLWRRDAEWLRGEQDLIQ